MYKITKVVSGKYLRATDTPILHKQQRLEARWAEYFSDVLNRTQPKIEAEEQDPDIDLDVSTAPPEKKGNHGSHKIPQIRKTPGKDSLNVELVKAEPEFAAQVVQPLFAAILGDKKLPDD